MKKLPFALFVGVVLAQLAAPLSLVLKHESILKNGVEYKFRTAPVDPADAFRGRYVALGFAETVAPVRAGENLKYRQPAFLSLRKDEAGFAQFGELSSQPPTGGDYLRVEYLFLRSNGLEKASFKLPFDRFYMEESKAPRAEAVYRDQGNRRSEKEQNAYVVVKVKGGCGTIVDLYLRDQPIREFLAGEPRKK